MVRSGRRCVCVNGFASLCTCSWGATGVLGYKETPDWVFPRPDINRELFPATRYLLITARSSKYSKQFVLLNTGKEFVTSGWWQLEGWYTDICKAYIQAILNCCLAWWKLCHTHNVNFFQAGSNGVCVILQARKKNGCHLFVVHFNSTFTSMAAPQD